MQYLILTLLIVWASWTAFGALLPKTRRKTRGTLARWADGRLPARVVAWIRPGFPTTQCGCGSACHEESPKTPKETHV